MATDQPHVNPMPKDNSIVVSKNVASKDDSTGTDSGVDELGTDCVSDDENLDNYLEHLNLTSSEADSSSTSIEYVIATAYYKGTDETQLTFQSGAKMTILSKETNDWWWGELDGICGYIPMNHVCTISPQEDVLQDWQDEEYYQSYGKLSLQLEMLEDKPRTHAYLKAVKSNAEYFKDKVVLDVGCGTGILSLFCAKYGQARKVYAVEASDSAFYAKSVVAENGFSDQIVVINNRIEELHNIITEQVDLIISEWMGTLLISEFMIESVIYARNYYLAPNGKMFPSTASLYIVPCMAEQVYNNNVTIWDNLYGFKFTSLKKHATENVFRRPIHNFIANAEHFLAEPHKVVSLDMYTVSLNDLEHIENECTFIISKPGRVYGFCTWFSVEFESLSSKGITSILDTGPSRELTHWKHPLLMLDNPFDVKTGDQIRVKFVMNRNIEMRRHLSVQINGVFECTEDENKTFSFFKAYQCWQ